MHNIWFNEAKKVYQLAKLPELDNDQYIGKKSVDKLLSNYEHWVLIGSFEADKLEDIVSEFQIISRNHQETSLT